MSVTASSTNAPAPAAGHAAPDPRARGVVRLLPPAERHLVSRFSYGITP